MKARPKLAVIIPNFNYERFVERAIRSVVDQQHPECELLVVDDGSNDNSWDVIERTGVRAIRQANGGQRLACLNGIDNTTAPFILFLDADDELKPGALSTILGALDRDVAKLQFSLGVIDAFGYRISGKQWSLDAFRSREALANEVRRRGVYRTPPTSGNVFRRDVCELLREAEYDRAVDGVILFAAPFFGDVVSLPQELGLYRIHGSNDSGLGRSPEAASIERDLRRFVARHDHLRKVLLHLGCKQDLTPSSRTFYYRECFHHAVIATGHQPKFGNWLRLLTSAIREPFSLKHKIGLSLFVVLSSILPGDRRKSLLAYRLQAGSRSASGLLRRIVWP